VCSTGDPSSDPDPDPDSDPAAEEVNAAGGALMVAKVDARLNPVRGLGLWLQDLDFEEATVEEEVST
jgi:hypothetical protein